jgi:hypothetical protein
MPTTLAYPAMPEHTHPGDGNPMDMARGALW